MNGSEDKRRSSRIIARAKELHEDEAFAPARRGTLSVSAAEVKADVKRDAKHTRRLIVIFVVISVAVALFSLLLPYVGFDTMGVGLTIYPPSTVIDAYGLWFNMNVMPLFDATLSNRTGQMMAAFVETYGDGVYNYVINRVVVTFIVILCGVSLALSGLLFQTAFRNPLAAPSSLGVSDGMTLGCLIFTMMGFSTIAQNPTLYVLLTYGIGAGSVAVVLLVSRFFAGGARYNVLDMLLIGTVVSTFVGGVDSFVQNFQLSDSAWFAFFDIQQATDALLTPIVRNVAMIGFVVTFVPALILRFRLNLIAFPDEEGRMLGIRAGVLRVFALIIGAAMQLIAIVSIGQVAMLSLAVPFVVRYALPADFRSQFLGNALIGCTVLLIAVAIQHFAVFGIITMPVGTIVSIFIIPFFVWMVAFGKGGW
ncbi:MAG: iron ABC transporter permease [Coriobacteriaceae bacterium]|nr:iron ABC transporter permease [Coriobacteriaceae bacterium]